MKGQNANRGNPQKNGHRRSNSRYNNQNGHLATDDGTDRLLYLVTKSIGKKVTVTITNGARYQGLLLSADLSSQGTSPLSVVIMHPTQVSKGLISEKSNIDENEVPEKLIIQSKDLIDLEVAEVDLNDSSRQTPQPEVVPPPQPSQQAQPASKNQPEFKTDSDISGRFQLKERELQRWVPEDDNNPVLSLDDDAFGSNNGQWDQFKVNEEKFGVEASYDEHLYTTRINTTASDYQERLAKAERLAKEIEGQTTSDRHILEERGIQVDDSGMDEEDKYSGVDRRGDELMAALRNASISSDASSSLRASSPGKYVPPRQRAAQYHNDPAIISSSAASKSKATAASPAPATETDATSSVQEKEAGTSKAQLAKPDSIPAKPQVPQHNESFRLNAQSEINSLREFSANFKIPHKMPQDLLPILSKDKLKQDEILKKQQETQRQKLAKEQAALQPPVQANSQQTPAQKKKADTAKAAFKLNPKAVAFTPSNKHVPLSPNPPKANFHRSPNNPSPRISNSRPYSGSGSSAGSNSSSRRHHQISPAEFFGGADRIPTKESQEKKAADFKFAFSLFITTKKNHQAKGAKTPVAYERTFKTPPTWDSNFDDTHDKLFPSVESLSKGPGMIIPSSQFIPSPLMGNPNVPAGYPAPNGSKFPMSPHQQQAVAAAIHFQQQQQFHAAMLYQQQFPGGVPPGQPPMPMYPGGEPPFMPPGGFMPPPGGFVPGGSPVNANLMMGQGSPYSGGNHHNYNNHHNGNGRRYNQNSSKRGGHN
ncbi:uncharacterized protein CANTADRAFT_6753 [Suhomyces tanzawaensis NRRL Y-17324]|uniref:LsmAD domain-containing protein n=1 Tax=Suhomyces tanzawaensis NRRL Y-17324 TaxID=984487 RepID=A0A1E4SFS4_9ASCO|nr:uncharacterized protein CANTADRAFT_6753 [Suhomyces tanzawaensis NRRL Y-17324]ODV78361.1 hypothetical protein CANTADRAFT_6753 [Suhomyces tanzawaensis NRRL Y-17324]